MRILLSTILILATVPAVVEQRAPSGRDYFNHWKGAGGVDEVGVNPYVCFPDPDTAIPGVFFIINATAVESDQQTDKWRK